MSDLVKFVIAGPLLAALLAACGGAAVYSAFRGAGNSYWEFLRIWWFGDAVGLMIFTPLFLSGWTPAATSACGPRAAPWPDGPVALGALAVLGLLLASRDGTLFGIHTGPVLLLPFVVYVAARFTLPHTALAVSAVALCVLILTARGRNPFGHATTTQSVVHAQEFIVIMSILALGLATLMSQLRTSRYELERANRELKEHGAALERANEELERAKTEVLALNEGLERRVKERTEAVELALAQVKQLQGLLPICAWCKSVRDDRYYWHSVETYISDRTDATFTHGICPSCFAKNFGDGRSDPA